MLGTMLIRDFMTIAILYTALYFLFRFWRWYVSILDLDDKEKKKRLELLYIIKFFSWIAMIIFTSQMMINKQKSVERLEKAIIKINDIYENDLYGKEMEALERSDRLPSLQQLQKMDEIFRRINKLQCFQGY